MAKSTKNFTSDLDPKLAAELLNVNPAPFPAEGVDGFDAIPQPLSARLEMTVQQLKTLVAEANRHLGESEAARLVGQALARDNGKRGDSAIYVTETGRIVLEVGTEVEATKKAQKPRKYKRRLPLLEDLRAEAKSLGLDISHLGAKRRAIWDAIQEVQTRKGKADPVDEGPMSAGADEITVTDPPSGPKPPKRGHFKLGDAVQVQPVAAKPKKPKPAIVNPNVTPAPAPADSEKPKPNMVELMEQTSDVNLRDLLGDEG